MSHSPYAGSSSKRLLLDHRVVASAENAALVLGAVEKEPRNPLFVEDRPWEARFDNLYANVLRDPADGLFKCWYNPFLYWKRPGQEASRETGLCYAVSHDGIAWEKPDLGLVEFEGSRANNLVLRRCHGACVRRVSEGAPVGDASARFMMFYKTQEERTPEERASGLMWLKVAHSPDGVRWADDPQVVMPKYPYKQADTHNNFIWDAPTARYVAITRTWDDDPGAGRRAHRLVARMESPDAKYWTRPVDVFRELPEEVGRRQTYAMPIFPYAGVYCGLLMMFNTGEPAAPDHDTVDCELAWSPNTTHWFRVCPGQALIPRGPEGAFDSHIVFGACSPVYLDGEMRLYYGGCNGPHGGVRAGGFGMARLRPDGFAGIRPVRPHAPAELITAPVRCTGRTLRVSADAARGSLRVGLVGTDSWGPSVGACVPITEDVTDRAVAWRDCEGMAPFRGRDIVLRFRLDSATLYAFSFSEDGAAARV